MAIATGPSAAAPSPMASDAAERAAVLVLSRDLLASDSATEVLRRECAEDHLASPPAIRAVRIGGPEEQASAEVRARLGAAPGQTVAYRHVRLMCGGHIMSDADNWYLPRRLTAAMNRALDQTQVPFGVAVRPLGFHRRTIGVETPSNGKSPLIHRAILVDAAGTPFSYVVERYTREALALTPRR
ncbi:MAG: hypothetical protein ABI376_05215 [Caulobacteraceae bacterium]